MDLTVTTTNSSLGLAAAVIVVYDPRALPLLVVPLVTVFLAYRAYATERQRHESLEFLYETTRTLSRSPEIVGALEGLLARSVEAFRAEIAEIVLFPSEGNAPLRTTHGPGDVRDEMLPIDSAIADELRALVDHDEPVTRVTPDSGSVRLRRYLEERGVTHAMLAMLPGETRVVGTMLLANRPGVVRDFSDADLRLFETLATNASVALQYDRLEQTVWQLRELQRQLEHQAYHDSLTGLANRTLFIDRVDEALAQARSDRRRAVRRHRRLQDRQRHARPHGRRPAADRGRRAPVPVRAPDRHRRALRRRRVRDPARPPRRAGGRRGGRRADPRRARPARAGRRRGGQRRRERRHRHQPRRRRPARAS